MSNVTPERELALAPSEPICDAHHHLWARPASPYLLPQIRRDVAASGHRVASTVYVEWRSHYLEGGAPEMRPVGEVAFARSVERAARDEPQVCKGIVGFAELCLGEAIAPALEAMVAAGEGSLKGLRYVASWDDDPEVLGGTAAKGPGLYREASFRSGLRLLERHGLVFDAWLFQTQLADLIDLARAFPSLPIVLNHTGGVLGIKRYAGQRYELFAAWHRGIKELAGCANVYMKLGGLGMKRCGFPFHGEPEKATSALLEQIWRPWIESCIEAFGAERCMFESNFPVDGDSCSYRVLWNSFKRLAAGCSASERAALLHDTAAAFYRLSP